MGGAVDGTAALIKGGAGVLGRGLVACLAGRSAGLEPADLLSRPGLGGECRSGECPDRGAAGVGTTPVRLTLLRAMRLLRAVQRLLKKLPKKPQLPLPGVGGESCA